MPFHHITSPIYYDGNMTKKVKIISEHNPTMASRLRANLDTSAYAVLVSEYASDVMATIGATTLFSRVDMRGTFNEKALAGTHAQKVVRRLMEETSESRLEEEHQPDTDSGAWIVYQGARRLYRVVVFNFTRVDV
jgi:hypothetical protein